MEGGDAYAKFKLASSPVGGGGAGSFYFNSPVALKGKEVTSMKYRWENRKQMADVRGMGLWAHAGWFVGAIFAVLGIIADAANVTLGLESTS